MATLTWRNVDAPSFAGATDGYRTGAQLFSNASKMGVDLVDQFTQAGATEADRAIMARQLAITDPTEYNRRLQDGSILGSDARNASLPALRAVGAQAGTLLDRSVKQQSYDQTGLENVRTRDNWRRADEAAPVINQANAAAIAGDRDRATALMSDPRMIGLRPEQFASYAKGTDAFSTSFADRRGTDENQAQTAWNNRRTVTSALDADAGRAAAQSVQMNSLSTKDAEAEIDRISVGMTPGVRQALINNVRGMGYNVFAPADGGGTAAGGKAASGGRSTGVAGLNLAPTNNALLDSFIGGLAKLETAGGSKTIKGPNGENSNNLFNIKDLGTGGTGFRALDKAEGSNDRYRVYANPEESRADLMELLTRKYPAALQAKTPAEFAKALKDGGYATDPDYVNKLTATIGDVSGIAPELTPAQRVTEALNNASKREAESLAAGEGIRGVQTRLSQNEANENFAEIRGLEGDRRDAVKAVNDILVGPNSPYKDSDVAQLVGHVNWLRENSKGRLNPAQAAMLLARNPTSAGNSILRGVEPVASAAADIAFGTIPRAILGGGAMVADAFGIGGSAIDAARNFRGRQVKTQNLANGLRIDDEAVYRDLNKYMTGDMLTQDASQRALNADGAVYAKALERYTDAEAELTMYESSPRGARRVEAARAKRDRALEALRQVSQSSGANPSLNPLIDRPVRQTVGTGR